MVAPSTLLFSTILLLMIFATTPSAFAQQETVIDRIQNFLAEIRSEASQYDPLQNLPEKTPTIQWQIRTWIEDRFEFSEEQKISNGIVEREEILEELEAGVSVAKERIQRVGEKLGSTAIAGLPDINEVNKLYEEFLIIEKIENKDEQQEKTSDFDNKVNSYPIVQNGCEKPINTMDILDAGRDNYYDKIKNEYCNKTLKNIDQEDIEKHLDFLYPDWRNHIDI